MKSQFSGKTILVTGGTGSIGSAIVKELLTFSPKKIRVFSRDETKQLALLALTKNNAKVNFLIGDIRDKERLSRAMENVDIVFHTAALKHVVACEKNPFEAVKTNVEGTQNVIDAAFSNGVSKVIAVSTDKATDPTNVLGCTKMLAEKLTLATFFYKGFKKTKFAIVRLGNVLGSRGSVVPIIIDQIKRGGPLTITDPTMTRFVMSPSRAVNLILKASELMKDREIFIFKMPVTNVGDIANSLIEIVNGQVKKKIDIKIIGKLPGERVHEKLLTFDESEIALETNDMFIITPNFEMEKPATKPYKYPGAKKCKVGEYNSKDQKLLSKEELKKILTSSIFETTDAY